MVMSAIDSFHKFYDESKIWTKNYFLGIPCWKLPFDMQVIQELIVKTKPDYIIETGTAYGGSALFYASICELINQGKVITIDLESKVNMEEINQYRCSERIDFMLGSSTNPIIVNKLLENECFDLLNDQVKCMVILDSWHGEDHVFKEMKIYSKFVSVGGYMIVEDTHAGKVGHPITWKWDDKGPMEAVNKWMEKNGDEWEIDYSCEKHLMSFNPMGYLRKIK